MISSVVDLSQILFPILVVAAIVAKRWSLMWNSALWFTAWIVLGVGSVSWIYLNAWPK